MLYVGLEGVLMMVITVMEPGKKLIQTKITIVYHSLS